MIIIKSFCNGLLIILSSLYSIIIHFFIGLFNVIIIFPKYFVLGIIYIFNRKRRNQVNRRRKSVIPLIMMILSLIIYFICVFLFSKWSVQNLKNKYLIEDIINSTKIIEKEENIGQIDETGIEEPKVVDNKYYPNDYWDYMSISFLEINFSELLNRNPETVGWIKVNGTNVNYPVVQSEDNSYYLNHSFNKSKNSNGWVFADYRSNLANFGKNTIIYGHNMTNKTMFGSLTWLLRNDWFSNDDNLNIKISTPTTNSVWRIFSVYTMPSETYYLKTVFNNNAFEEWLTTIKSRSIKDLGTTITIDDKILTLSTCDDAGTKRMVTHAKMINIEYK